MEAFVEEPKEKRGSRPCNQGFFSFLSGNMAVRSSGTPSMYQQGALGVLEGLLMLVTRGVYCC